MKNKFLILFTFLLLTNCEYKPIYSVENFDFKLKNIISSKDNQLNSNVEKKLLVFSNQESQKIISLKIDVQRKINILTKDSKGDPSRYEMIIDIKLETTYGQNQNVIRSFQEKFNYNTNSNRFELNQYEKEVENLLINKNIDRIIAYLSKV